VLHAWGPSLGSYRVLRGLLGFLGNSVAQEVELDARRSALSSRTHGQVETPEQAQHTRILGRHQRVKTPNAPIARRLDQSVGHRRAQPTPLPAILDQGRVLRPLAARFTGVAHDRYDLLLSVGLERSQGEWSSSAARAR
jgi:23S rRNA G2069 N7-methylase RlmK/C1962 C5-methylase RlmI